MHAPKGRPPDVVSADYCKLGVEIHATMRLKNNLLADTVTGPHHVEATTLDRKVKVCKYTIVGNESSVHM